MGSLHVLKLSSLFSQLHPCAAGSRGVTTGMVAWLRNAD